MMQNKAGKRDKFIKKSRIGMAEALKSRDMLLGYVAKSIDGMDEAIHLLTEKLEDIYSIYFPEFRLEDKRKYAEFVLAFDRKKPDAKALEIMVGQGKSADLLGKAKTTLGADLNDEDMKMLRSFANRVVEAHKLRDEYMEYQEKFAEEVCPNMKHLSNAAIAAKLIAHTGSLRKLALLPASTIQVLGAEKALFKHLRSKGRIPPPKHGIIFQFPAIGTAPKSQRGKIARALAAKLAIAARADAFSHNFIAPILKADLDKRFAEIRAEAEKEVAERKAPANKPDGPPPKSQENRKR